MRKKMYGSLAAAVVLSLAVWWINSGGEGYAGDLERKIENVKVSKLWIETDPPAGSEFRGQLTVIDNGAPGRTASDPCRTMGVSKKPPRPMGGKATVRRK